MNKDWAQSLLRRMNFVQRKATTVKSKYTVENFAELKAAFLKEVVSVVNPQLGSDKCKACAMFFLDNGTKRG